MYMYWDIEIITDLFNNKIIQISLKKIDKDIKEKE